MRFPRLAVLALALAGLGVLAATPARADGDGWHHGWRDGWHQRWHSDDDDWDRDRGPRWGVVVGPPPPVYYAPPRAYYPPPPRAYYPPPPVVFAPGFTLGIGVR